MSQNIYLKSKKVLVFLIIPSPPTILAYFKMGAVRPSSVKSGSSESLIILLSID